MEAKLASLVFTACEDTYQSTDPLQPERSLATAILERAIKDAAQDYGATFSRGHRPGGAVWWLEDDGIEYLFSYRNVCLILDIEPTAMRRAIARMMAAHTDRSEPILIHRKTFAITIPRKSALKVA